MFVCPVLLTSLSQAEFYFFLNFAIPMSLTRAQCENVSRNLCYLKISSYWQNFFIEYNIFSEYQVHQFDNEM